MPADALVARGTRDCFVCCPCALVSSLVLSSVHEVASLLPTVLSSCAAVVCLSSSSSELRDSGDKEMGKSVSVACITHGAHAKERSMCYAR